MSLKRPAEDAAEGDGDSKRAAANPFAGISLKFSSPAPTGGAPVESNPFAGVSLSASAPQANPFAGVSLSAPSAPAASLFTTAAAATAPNTNPFAGVSLSAPSPSAPSLFTTAAAATQATGSGFGTAQSSSAPTTFGEASKSLAFGNVSAGGSAQSNPFAGLSLSAGSAGTGAGLFSSAVSSLSASTTAGTATAENAPLAPTAAAKQACDAASLPHSVANAVPKNAPAPSPAASDSGAEEEEEAVEAEQEDDAKQGTGEEDEEVIFHAECKLSKLVRHGATDAPSEAPSEGGSSPSGGGNVVSGASAAAGQENGWRWQEKGCGILHINWNAKTGSGRLVMRMRGVLKVLLNTPVFPTTKYERVGQKSVRFVGIDPEDHPKDGKISMCAFRLTLQNSDQLAKLLSVLQPICSGGAGK